MYMQNPCHSQSSSTWTLNVGRRHRASVTVSKRRDRPTSNGSAGDLSSDMDNIGQPLDRGSLCTQLDSRLFRLGRGKGRGKRRTVYCKWAVLDGASEGWDAPESGLGISGPNARLKHIPVMERHRDVVRGRQLQGLGL